MELSHEALLREWPRYRAWLEEDGDGRRLHAHLQSSAREWEASDRDPGDVYRGARLTAALDWAGQHSDELSSLERRFLEASDHHAERNAWRLRAVLAGVALLLLASVVAGFIALVQKQHASTEARVALARQLGAQAATEPRLDLAMLLAHEAVSLDRSPQTEGSLLATLQRNPAVIGTLTLPINGPPEQLAVSPDGGTLAVGAPTFDQVEYVAGLDLSSGTLSAGELGLYDARTQGVNRPRLTDFGSARAPVYSSDGSVLVYPMAGDPPAIAVRDARTLTLMRKLTLDPQQVAGYVPDMAHARILIAPDGHTIYCAYQDFSSGDLTPGATFLARWSLPSGRLLSTTRIDGAAALAVGLTDAGARVVVIDARAISEFETQSLRRLSSARISPAAAAPSIAAISTDGHTIAIASQAGTVFFIDVATGHARRAIGPNIGTVASLACSPDGRAVASAANNSVTIWHPRSGTPAQVLSVPGGQVQGLTFSPDGRALYTSSVGGLVLEWDLTGRRSFGRRFVLNGRSPCCDSVAPLEPPLALSPDGTTFAARLGTSTVGLFSTRTLQPHGSFSIKRGAITALAWSPSGPEIAVGGRDGLAQLWRVDGTPRLVRSLNGLQPALGQPEAIQAIAFSPNGRLIAASDTSETAQTAGIVTPEGAHDRLSTLAIWRPDSGTLSAAPVDLGTGPAPYDPLVFSPDGRFVAVSSPDGGDRILDATTAQTRQTLHPIGGEFTGSLAFAPDGTLATGTLSGTVQLWNPISGEQIAAPVPVTAGAVSSIAFDHTGRRFATTASQDGTVKLFAIPTLQQEGTTLNTDPGAASTAAFEPHRSTLLVLDNRRNGFTWPMSLTAWEQRACAVAGRDLTAKEWSTYIPGQAHARVCPRPQNRGTAPF